MSKYHSRKITTPEGTFDSKREYERWCELKLLQRAGKIRELRGQVRYNLVPAQYNKIRNERPVDYIADFVYLQNGRTVVEDVKGKRTPEYIIKRKLMLYLRGISVLETK